MGDALGSVRPLRDSGGNVTLAQSYQPYGEVLDSAGNSSAAYGFTGEWTGSTNTMNVRSRYYYAGSTRVAMRTGSSTLNYLLGDHLGSQAITTDSNGAYQSEIRYYPWGTERYSSGTTPTTYHFTGQRLESALGLYYYGARWYDPTAGRFVQPDTIVPDPGNTQDWDRYVYTVNNPLRYTDPSGHCIGRPGDPDNPDKQCGFLYFHIRDYFEEVLLFLDRTFNFKELADIFSALNMVANAFSKNMDAFRNAFGQFSIMHKPIIGVVKASGMTPPGLNEIYLSSSFDTSAVIHELAHIFDFTGSNGDPDKYKSQSFVNWFGNGCKVGKLGCVSNNNSNYCNINKLSGGGCGDWNPIIRPDQGTTWYGAYSSVEDFADSFTSYVLIQNPRDQKDRGIYIVFNTRTLIIGAWVNKATP